MEQSKIPGKLTEKQRERVLWLLYNTHNNSDKTIAEKIGSTHLDVSQFTTWHSKQVMDRINKKVNARYKEQERKKASQ